MLNFRCLDVQCIHIWRVKFVGGGEKCRFEVQMHSTLITSHLPPSLYRIGLAILFLAGSCISDLWTLFSAAAGGSFERFVLCNSMMCNLLSLTLTLKSAVFLASCIYLYVQQELLCQEYRFVLCVVYVVLWCAICYLFDDSKVCGCVIFETGASSAETAAACALSNEKIIRLMYSVHSSSLEKRRRYVDVCFTRN